LGHLTRRIEAWATYGAERGITYGYPLLDKRLLTFCLGLPTDALYHRGETRALFRRAVADVLPDSVRLKPIKSEPANLARLTCLLPEGFYRLFEKVRPTAPNPPEAAYINVDKLDAVLQLRDETKFWGGIIPRTVACLAAGVLKDHRMAA
jgi:asparagine synthase (glutamine-hydrolysing)